MQVTHVNLSKPKYNAVILLGYHGVGKDTLANRLIKDNSAFVNIKMSKMYKDLLQHTLGLTEAEINGTDLAKVREAPISICANIGEELNFPFSALDILNLLFQGSRVDSRFVDSHVTYALDSIPEGKIPVFTDIRRIEEYEAVCRNFNPVIIFLKDKDVPPGDTDGNIPQLVGLDPDTIEIELIRCKVNKCYNELLSALSPYFKLSYDKRYLVDVYCEKLFTLNETILPNRPEVDLNKFVSHMLFGLIEELTEYHLSATFDEAKAEAGDVMAYLVLSLYGCVADSFGKESAASYIGYMVVDSFSLNIAQDSYSAFTLHELINHLAGCAKRYLREKKVIEASDILAAYVWLSKKLEALGLDLKDVLSYNIDKLTRRASTGNLFQGKGSNR